MALPLTVLPVIVPCNMTLSFINPAQFGSAGSAASTARNPAAPFLVWKACPQWLGSKCRSTGCVLKFGVMIACAFHPPSVVGRYCSPQGRHYQSSSRFSKSRHSDLYSSRLPPSEAWWRFGCRQTTKPGGVHRRHRILPGTGFHSCCPRSRPAIPRQRSFRFVGSEGAIFLVGAAEADSAGGIGARYVFVHGFGNGPGAIVGRLRIDLQFLQCRACRDRQSEPGQASVRR